MIIYCSSIDYATCESFEQLFPKFKCYTLVSYAQPVSDHCNFMTRPLRSKPILDSGTYTINNSKHMYGRPILFEGYMDYLKQFANYFEDRKSVV